MRNLLQDIRFAARSLGKSRGLSVVIVLLLGFGIGANTALFSLIRAVLLRPIPGVERPEQLVRIRRATNGRAENNQSYPDYLDYRGQTNTLASVVAERLITVRLDGRPATMEPAAIVTGNYFETLGVKALAGRLIGPGDDRLRDGHPVVVISERFWERRFARDRETAGRAITLNGYPFTIVGVVAGPFEGVEFGEPAAIWMPMMMVKHAMTRDPSYHWLEERRAGWLTFYGRLRPGQTVASAQTELDGIARRLESQYPESNAGRGVYVSGHPNMLDEQRARIRNLFTLLGGAVCFTLLVACGNVANLLLARFAGRSREMAIQLALGATRWMVLRRLLAESLLLASAGGALGLLLAPWLLPLLRNVWNPRDLASAASVLPDPSVLAFTLAASLMTALVAGFAPAWGAARTNVFEALKTGARAGRGRSRLARAWVVAQVAFSVTLVAAGALVVRSMQRILAIDYGYRPERVVMATMDLSLLGYSREQGLRFFFDLLDEVRRLPGIQSASLGKSSPAVDWSDRAPLFRSGEAPAASRDYLREPGALLADRNIIAPEYFRTLGIPLLAGRDFTLSDRAAAPPVAIVSKALAERLWPRAGAVGRQIVMPVDGRTPPPTLTVVGVAADSRYRSVLNEPSPLIYVPLSQNYDSIARLMVSVDGDPGQMTLTLRRALQASHPEMPLRTLNTMREQIDQSLSQQRAASSLLSFFGLLAIALACAGIHGILAQLVADRTREIGIRMALGAPRLTVLRKIVLEAAGLAAAGIAIGLPCALAAKGLLSAFIYGSPGIQLVFGEVLALFMLVAIGASVLPARRAAGIDPAIALRQE